MSKFLQELKKVFKVAELQLYIRTKKMIRAKNMGQLTISEIDDNIENVKKQLIEHTTVRNVAISDIAESKNALSKYQNVFKKILEIEESKRDKKDELYVRGKLTNLVKRVEMLDAKVLARNTIIDKLTKNVDTLQMRKIEIETLVENISMTIETKEILLNDATYGENFTFSIDEIKRKFREEEAAVDAKIEVNANFKQDDAIEQKYGIAPEPINDDELMAKINKLI